MKKMFLFHRTCFRHVIGFCGTNHYALYATLMNGCTERAFSGAARFIRLPEIPNSPDGSAIVEFQAGTITEWHSHSQGQYLIVT